MKSFSQLKKDLQVGVKIKTILNNVKPEKNNQVRELIKVQTNAIVFKDETHTSGTSYLWYPKASLVEYEDNIFKIYEEPNKYNNNTKTLLFVYEILK